MFMELKNKIWLKNEYEINGLTIEKIAQKIGSNYGAVRKALIFHDIKIRDSYLSRRISKGLNKKLEDGEWLRQKYIEEKLSLLKIGKILNSNFNHVRSAILRHGISLRTRSEGQKIRYNQDGYEDYFCFNKSVIEGCLLGDGGLVKYNKYNHNSFPSFAKGNIGYDHVKFVADILFTKDAHKRIAERDNASGQNMFRLSTLTHFELNVLYHDWYPDYNNYEKLIPDSLKINKEVLLHWFMDDGYSYWVKYKEKYRYLRVQFATQCFTKESCDKLYEKIKEHTGLNIRPRYHQKHGKIAGYGYYMELSQKQNLDFFNIIGPCPVPSMEYKWKQ